MVDSIDPFTTPTPNNPNAIDTAESDAAAPETDQNRPPETPVEPEDETDEEWARRFIEENIHLASPPVVRPPAPPPQPWDGPRSQWKVPDHLSMPHPNGGYMAMALMSRTMDDLDEVTGGKRAATYEEVDKYFGHALIAEGLVPFTHTADEAIRWWKAGGYRVLGGTAGGTGAAEPLAESDTPSNHAANASYDLNLAGIDDSVSPFGPTDRIPPTDPWASRFENPDRPDSGFAARARDLPLLRNAEARLQPATIKTGTRKEVEKPGKTPPAPPGTNLSTYDAGFGGLGHGINGDYRTTPEERAWLREPESLAGPDIAYPDGSPGNEQTSSKKRREIRENVGYLYTLPEVKALLDVFAHTEETEGDGYERTHYPNKEKLPDLTTFHGKVPIGRYQITRENWENFGGILWSRKDFSPTTQDLIAITQLVQKHAIDELLNGNLSGALSIAATIFASIPMSSEKDYSYYSGGKGNPKGGPVTDPPRQPTPVRFNALPALFVQRLNARKEEFRNAERAWKERKEIPQAFISPLRWRSFGLKGF